MERVCSCCKVSKPFTNEFFYTTGHHAAKCRLCKNIVIGNKNTTIFMDNLTDNWKKYDILYFERNTDKIFNTSSGKYIINTHSIMNMFNISAKDIKWEIFNGTIEPNKIVKFKNEKSIALDNLECDYIYCNECGDLIENPTIRSIHCSKRCLLNDKNKKATEKRNNLNGYLSSKFTQQKCINKIHLIDIDYN